MGFGNCGLKSSSTSYSERAHDFDFIQQHLLNAYCVPDTYFWGIKK